MNRQVFVVLLCFFPLVACGPSGSGQRAQELPWDRRDLWRAPDGVEIKPAAIGGQQGWHRRLVHLGPSEIRDPEKVSPYHLKVVKSIPASEIRALEQVSGSRLRFDLDLGRQAVFSFRPLRNEAYPCICTYRVLVRSGEEEREVYRGQAPHGVPPGPAMESVDLAPFAGQAIQLLLEVTAPEGESTGGVPRALWGSPAVHSRKPLPAEFEGPPAATPERPNVLLIGADTLRADALGAYGATLSITPALDHLASQSDVWLEAYSAFNVTNPSFTSILTGLYGKNHDVYNLNTPLPQEHVTLAEVFSAAGYRTLSTLAARHLRDGASGLAQGFDRVILPNRTLTAEAAVDVTLNWIAESPQPFFVWLHLFDPHTPHTPPAPFALGYAADRRWGVAPVGSWQTFRPPGEVEFVNQELGGAAPLYAGEVAYMDRQVDRLLDFLESRGLLRNTIIVFVSDHGENLEDHGMFYAHHGLFETTLHVPLMIRWPGEASVGRRLEGLVQTIDLFPTLLATAGLDVPESDGEDLRQITREGRSGRRAVFSEHAHQRGVRVRTPGWAFYRSYGHSNWIPDGEYLYDLRQDPGEETNLAGQGIEKEAELGALLDRWLGSRRKRARAIPSNMTQEDIERLRSLGYWE